MKDFGARIESQVLAIGHSPIPAAEKAVLRLLFNEWKNGSAKMTQRYIASTVPDLGSHRNFEDSRALESTLRQVRQTIRDLRVLRKAPILSDNHGYWLPRTEAEVRTYLIDLERDARAQAAAHFETYAAMKSSLGIVSAFFDRQSTMFDRPHEVAVPSDSTPERTYSVRALPAGGFSCECDGYIYRRTCRHIEAAKHGTIAVS